MDYDIIIIGAGPGGYEMAAEASCKYEMNTALIEKSHLGGTCLNRGCIPTKTFLHTSELLDEVKKKGKIFALTKTDAIGADMKHLQKRKNEVVDELRGGVKKLLKGANVDVFEGLGSITGKGRVKVTGSDGGTVQLSGKYIVIATGSVPDRQEELEGSDIPGVVTSDELLDIEKIPSSLLILGGGVIGMEFASIFNALGTKVTVMKASAKIFNNMDKELGQSLKMLMKKRGVDIISEVDVKRIERSGGELSCIYAPTGDEDENQKIVNAEMILLAKGRRANTQGLIDNDADDEVKNLELDARGRVVVDGEYRTNVSGIYAIGDCISSKSLIGHAQLAHVATSEGRNLLAILNGKKPASDLKAVPACIYTSPEIASTGINPDDCKSEGMDVIIKKIPMGANGKSVLTQQERGFIKVIADASDKKILGASMMCARATDMISIFSEAIVNGLTVDDLQRIIFPHPTFCEAIGDAVRAF